MKKFTLQEAEAMLKQKRGAGKTKTTRVHLEFDIEFKSGKPGAEMFVSMILPLIKNLVQWNSPYAGYDRNVHQFEDKSWVETEHEENPDWK